MINDVSASDCYATPYSKADSQDTHETVAAKQTNNKQKTTLGINPRGLRAVAKPLRSLTQRVT